MNREETTTTAPPSVPHVVIVGGGFGGLNAAKAFKDQPVRVTLIDRRNHHLFQPLLYQVATATLSPADIASAIRAVLRNQKNVTVLMAEATAVDADARRVILADDEPLCYDYLILAPGTTHSYFGHDEWAPLAPGLKSVEEALEIRRRVLWAFEAAEREDDPAVRDALMTFVIVGGGPTGVELAGSIAEIARHTLVRDFDRIDPTKATIYLVEGLDRILPTFPEKLGRKAEEYLKRLGVQVRTNSLVTGIDPEGVTLGEERIPARTVLWAAGVKASPLGRSIGAEVDRAGRVLVNPDLTVPGHPEIFVVGDLAAARDAKGRPLPGTAPVAIQEGRWAAENVLRAVNKLPLRPFRYKDRGNMATIGRNVAVADIKGIKVSGFLAWLLWAVVHVFNLIGYRNRILVSVHWIWAYVTFQRGARLITEGREG